MTNFTVKYLLLNIKHLKQYIRYIVKGWPHCIALISEVQKT